MSAPALVMAMALVTATPVSPAPVSEPTGERTTVAAPCDAWATACASEAPGAHVAGPDAPVADAAMRGDAEEVRRLLADGADVNARQGDGMTALHWAALNRDADLARMLLDAGAEVGASTRVGEHTPLHVAARAQAADVVDALLVAGADPDATTTKGVTPLHFAAEADGARSIELLVAAGANVDARESVWNQTPLMFAAPKGRLGAVMALLEQGADFSVTARVVDIPERSAQDRQAQRARMERMAAARVEPTEPSATGASTGAIAPSTTYRTERPVSGEGRPAPTEREAAEEAERRSGEPIPLNYSDLVGTHGGLGAIHLAVREGQVDVVRALLAAGADINQPTAGDGSQPLLLATINGYFDLAMELLQSGADPTLASDAGATPLYTTLNMHWAPKARHPQPTVYQQQRTSYLDLMRALLDAGVDPNARLNRTLWYTTYNRDLLGVDRSGATPFWRAAYALDIPAMRLLLEYGADPNLPTVRVPERRFSRGDTTDHSGLAPVPMGGPAVHPIHAASGVGYGQGFAGNSHRHVPDGWVPAVRFLVEELGADVNQRDHNGYTPVHHAAARGDNQLIEYLVQQGADVTLVARNGRTTVDMANGPVQRVQPYPETVSLLERLGAKNNHRCVSC